MKLFFGKAKNEIGAVELILIIIVVGILVIAAIKIFAGKSVSSETRPERIEEIRK